MPEEVFGPVDEAFLSFMPPDMAAYYRAKPHELKAFIAQAVQPPAQRPTDLSQYQNPTEVQNQAIERAIAPPFQLPSYPQITSEMGQAALGMVGKALTPAGDALSALQNAAGIAITDVLPYPNETEAEYWSKRGTPPVLGPAPQGMVGRYLSRMAPGTSEGILGTEPPYAPLVSEMLPHLTATAENVFVKPFTNKAESIMGRGLTPLPANPTEWDSELAKGTVFSGRMGQPTDSTRSAGIGGLLRELREDAIPVGVGMGVIPPTPEAMEKFVSQDTSTLGSFAAAIGPEVIAPAPPIATILRKAKVLATPLKDKVAKVIAQYPELTDTVSEMNRTMQLAKQLTEETGHTADWQETYAAMNKADVTPQWLEDRFRMSPEDAAVLHEELVDKNLVPPIVQKIEGVETDLNGIPTTGTEYKLTVGNSEVSFIDPIGEGDAPPSPRDLQEKVDVLEGRYEDSIAPIVVKKKPNPLIGPPGIPAPTDIPHPFDLPIKDEDLKAGHIDKYQAKRLGIRQRTSRPGEFTKNMLGGFWPLSNAAITRYAGNIPVAIHEITHYTDSITESAYRRTTQFDNELIPLGSLTTPQKTVNNLTSTNLAERNAARKYVMKEGFAQFGLWYTLNPDAAKIKAPNFYSYFQNEILENFPFIKQAYNGSQYIANKIQNLGALDLAAAHTVSHLEDPTYLKTPWENFEDKMRRAYSLFIDSSSPFETLDSKTVVENGDLVKKPMDDIDKLSDAIAAFRGRFGMQQDMLHNGVAIFEIDPVTEMIRTRPSVTPRELRLGPETPIMRELYQGGYKDLFKLVPKGHDVANTLTLMSAYERHLLGEVQPFDWSPAIWNTVEGFVRTVNSDPNYAWVKQFRDQRHKFMDAVFDMMEEEGLIAADKRIQFLYKLDPRFAGTAFEQMVTGAFKDKNIPVLKDLITQGFLKRRYEWHVPLQRVMDDADSSDASELLSSDAASTAVKEFFRSAKGSFREYRPWVESDIKFLASVSASRAYNHLMRKAYKLASDPTNLGISNYIERLPREKLARHISEDAARKTLNKKIESQLDNNIISPLEADVLKKFTDSLNKDDLFIEYFSKIPYDPKNGIVTFQLPGAEKAALRIDKNLMKAIKAMAPPDLDLLDSMLSSVNTVIRHGAVLWSPGFWATNVLSHDPFLAAISSKHAPNPALVTYPLAVAKGLLDLLEAKYSGKGILKPFTSEKQPSNWYRLAMQSGLGNSTLADSYRTLAEAFDAQKLANLERVEKTTGGMLRRAAIASVNMLGEGNKKTLAFQELGEIASRLPEFIFAAKTTPIDTTTRAAREVVLDYGRRGSLLSHRFRTVPFFNASMQAVDKFWRLHADKTAILRAAILGVGSTLMYAAYDQVANLHSSAQPYEIEEYYVFPNPINPDGPVLRFPVPRFFRPYHAAIVTALGAIRGKDPRGLSHAFQTYARQAVREGTPAFTTPLLALAEINWGDQGYSWYRGREVVPDAMMDKSAYQRYHPHTGVLWKALGKVTEKVGQIIPPMEEGISPLKLEYLANQWTGGAAGSVVGAGELVGSKFGLLDSPVRAPTMPLLNRFMRTRYAGQSYTQELYEAIGKLERKKNDPTKEFSNEDQKTLEKYIGTQQYVKTLHEAGRSIAESAIPAADKDTQLTLISRMESDRVGDVLGFKFPRTPAEGSLSSLSPKLLRELEAASGGAFAMTEAKIEKELQRMHKEQVASPERISTYMSKERSKARAEARLRTAAYQLGEFLRYSYVEQRALIEEIAKLSAGDIDRLKKEFSVPGPVLEKINAGFRKGGETNITNLPQTETQKEHRRKYMFAPRSEVIAEAILNEFGLPNKLLEMEKVSTFEQNSPKD